MQRFQLIPFTHMDSLFFTLLFIIRYIKVVEYKVAVLSGFLSFLFFFSKRTIKNNIFHPIFFFLFFILSIFRWTDPKCFAKYKGKKRKTSQHDVIVMAPLQFKLVKAQYVHGIVDLASFIVRTNVVARPFSVPKGALLVLQYAQTWWA